MISVIIPTYNRQNTIKRAIESVLNQTYKDVELIIVDDCSTDNTEEIVRNIKDSRLVYYKLQSNSGACFARNYGISHAKGDYIAFQDSDDEWFPNKLEEQLKNMKKKNSDIDFCGYVKNNGLIKTKLPSFKTIICFKMNGYEKALSYGNFIGTPTILLKKGCTKDIIFDEELPRFQDWDFVIRLSSIYSISYSNKILMNSYIQNDSITNNNEKLSKAVDIMLNKNYTYIDILKSTLYLLLSQSCKKDKKREYYLLSLKAHFSIKTFIKYLINY